MHLSLVILGAGILPPGKAALLVPRFLPLFLPSLSPRSLAPLPRPTFPFVTVSPPSLISFHFPFFFRFSRIAYISFFQRGVASRCYPCFPVSSSSSILPFRFDEATITRPLVPLPPPNFAGLVDFRASPFAFLPTPPPFSPSSIHPSIPLSIRAVPFFKVSHLPRQSHFLPDFANPSVSKNRGFEFPRIVFPPLSNGLVLSLLPSLSFPPRYLFPAQTRLISVFFFLLLLFPFPLSFRSNLSIFIPPPLLDLATNSPPSQRAFKSRSSSQERGAIEIS